MATFNNQAAMQAARAGALRNPNQVRKLEGVTLNDPGPPPDYSNGRFIPRGDSSGGMMWTPNNPGPAPQLGAGGNVGGGGVDAAAVAAAGGTPDPGPSPYNVGPWMYGPGGGGGGAPAPQGFMGGRGGMPPGGGGPKIGNLAIAPGGGLPPSTQPGRPMQTGGGLPPSLQQQRGGRLWDLSQGRTPGARGPLPQSTLPQWQPQQFPGNPNAMKPPQIGGPLGIPPGYQNGGYVPFPNGMPGNPGTPLNPLDLARGVRPGGNPTSTEGGVNAAPGSFDWQRNRNTNPQLRG